PTPTPTPPPTGDCDAPWQSSKVYNDGDKVSQNNNIYQAHWWTKNQSPADNNGPWSVWELVSGC
ncbi:MAG: glycoside hydrolase, partial [Psychromonas sp.]|nr:glycoside hydrolase [Psychromonas sp.]